MNIIPLVVLLLCLIYGSIKQNGKTIEIVVARYNEDLKWLGEAPFNKYPVIIYNKGSNDDFIKWKNIKEIVNLENVGKCDHTYLYHIIRNYYNLADVTIFLPGSNDTDYKSDKSKILLGAVEQHGDTVFVGERYDDIKIEKYNFKLDKYITKYSKNKSLNPESTLKLASVRPFGKWFESRFGDIKINYISYGGIIAISKRDIQQHPVSRYENLIKELETSSNPEVGHYFERAWAAVFHPLHNVLYIHKD